MPGCFELDEQPVQHQQLAAVPENGLTGGERFALVAQRGVVAHLCAAQAREGCAAARAWRRSHKTTTNTLLTLRSSMHLLLRLAYSSRWRTASDELGLRRSVPGARCKGATN